MRIVAFDPGLVTGWAIYNNANGEFRSAETPAGSDGLGVLVAVADAVLAESYIVTSKTAKLSQQTDALAELGRIEATCRKYSRELVLQMPSAKKYGKDKLKSLGWNNPTTDNHADDAAAHLVRYLLKNKLFRVEEMLKIRRIL